MKSFKYLYLLFSLISFSAAGQQTYIFNQGYLHPAIYNPARLGESDGVDAFLHYRQQWEGVQGAPETFLLSVEGALNDGKMGLGIMAFSDNLNLINNSGAYLSYRYTIALSLKSRLAMGLSGGILRNDIFFDRMVADQQSETTIYNNVHRGSAADAMVGISYAYQRLNVGFSVAHLFASNLRFADRSNSSTLSYKVIPHYTFDVSYTYPLADYGLKLAPFAFARTAQGLPVQVEGGVATYYQDVAWLSLSVRQNAGYAVGVGVKVLGGLKIGYSREFSTARVAADLGSTNEVFLAFSFGKAGAKQPAAPAASTSYSEQRAEADSKNIDKLNSKNELLQRKVDAQQRIIDEQKDELARLAEINARDKDSIQGQRARYEVPSDSIPEVAADSQAPGYMVTVGVYLRLEDAKYFQKMLMRDFGVKTSVYARPDRKYYFVYTLRSGNKPQLLKEIKRLNGLKMDSYVNGNIWIYGEK